MLPRMNSSNGEMVRMNSLSHWTGGTERVDAFQLPREDVSFARADKAEVSKLAKIDKRVLLPEQTCPNCDYGNAGNAGGAQFPVAVTTGDLVCVCATPRLGQGGATAPQASVGAV